MSITSRKSKVGLLFLSKTLTEDSILLQVVLLATLPTAEWYLVPWFWTPHLLTVHQFYPAKVISDSDIGQYTSIFVQVNNLSALWLLNTMYIQSLAYFASSNFHLIFNWSHWKNVLTIWSLHSSSKVFIMWLRCSTLTKQTSHRGCEQVSQYTTIGCSPWLQLVGVSDEIDTDDGLLEPLGIASVSMKLRS